MVGLSLGVKSMQYFRIMLNGYGGESVYGKITKEQYEFWNNEEKLEELGFEDGLSEYMWDRDEYNDRVPEEAQFENEWYDQDDIEHSNGVTLDSARLVIDKIDSGEPYEAKHLEDIWDGDVTTLIEEQDIETDENVLDLDEFADKDGHNYVFYGMSVEKGNFFDAILELKDDEELDISKFNFGVCEMPNGDNILSDVTYNGEYLDNYGGDTNGKAMYMEVWDY